MKFMQSSSPVPDFVSDLIPDISLPDVVPDVPQAPDWLPMVVDSGVDVLASIPF